MSVHLVHTAQVHCATFDHLRDLIAPGVEVFHHVFEPWLERARSGQDDGLEAEIGDYLRQLDGPVLCTCSTIGPMAEATGALRIDWPLMQAAAKVDGCVLLVYCLDSTSESSRALLQRALDEVGSDQAIICLSLSQRWPLFEAGQTDDFAAAIAQDVQDNLDADHDIKVVVLAQASMAAAADKLEHVNLPVLSSPKLALEAVLSSDGVKAG
ncbi:MAG: hypothetical protein AAFN80_00025 [Pseudomonadota bacterium]